MSHVLGRIKALLVLTLFPALGFAHLPYNMPYGVTPNSHHIYNLHMTVFIVCCVIGLVVFGLVAYSIFRFRKSKGAIPSGIDENITIEIIWTVIPFLILIGLAIPATNILGKIHDTSEAGLTIKVTGYQWKWQYEYLDQDIAFFSFLSTPLDQVYGKAPKNKWFLLEVDEPVVVPVDTKVKLLITSNDVIHSWWVPALGVKQDAIPGFINENWFKISEPGEYRGQCGELCGINHGFMPIVVKAVPQEEFATWVVAKKKTMKPAMQAGEFKKLTKAEVLALGKKEYDRNCAMCHEADGAGQAYSFPALKGSRVITGPLDETITYVMRGVPNAAMQGFGKILDNISLAAVITYVRDAWGNGDVIRQAGEKVEATPNDVQTVRERLYQ